MKKQEVLVLKMIKESSLMFPSKEVWSKIDDLAIGQAA